MPADSFTRLGVLSATAAFALTSAKGAAKAPVMGSGEQTHEVKHDLQSPAHGPKVCGLGSGHIPIPAFLEFGTRTIRKPYVK